VVSDHEFQPVEGETFPVSAKKSFLIIGLALVMLPVGIGLTWLWGTDTTIPLINKQVTWWGALIGLVAVIGGVLLPPIVLWQWLVRKERLVIGTEYLQVVVTKGGRDVVKKQIAVKNIHSAAVQKHAEMTVVAIQLRDIHAPDLVPAGGEYLTKYMADRGFHLSIDDSYQVSAADICSKIVAASSK
jgi:hypothetical protein